MPWCICFPTILDLCNLFMKSWALTGKHLFASKPGNYTNPDVSLKCLRQGEYTSFRGEIQKRTHNIGNALDPHTRHWVYYTMDMHLLTYVKLGKKWSQRHQDKKKKWSGRAHISIISEGACRSSLIGSRDKDIWPIFDHNGHCRTKILSKWLVRFSVENQSNRLNLSVIF